TNDPRNLRGTVRASVAGTTMLARAAIGARITRRCTPGVSAVVFCGKNRVDATTSVSTTPACFTAQASPAQPKLLCTESTYTVSPVAGVCDAADATAAQPVRSAALGPATWSAYVQCGQSRSTGSSSATPSALASARERAPMSSQR